MFPFHTQDHFLRILESGFVLLRSIQGDQGSSEGLEKISDKKRIVVTLPLYLTSKVLKHFFKKIY